ncbi:DUF910 family protein [Siminovitchia acidinfaciens]|uniref:DUF910 family protein n=1 Tax=Siminovitchia acidinfaciens TaxID=2321395 RepID=A0A429XYK1_9BACI|nr:YqgQ family protein [Siminovitchia acidinfaciens]RST73816.1 DUF910 family protein [Siminovitchia acidinfaciens]VEF47801.1 cytoplasmic protein [Bacillus freudenreichii]
MNSVYDVQQLLKKFGIYVYIGDRLSDLELMEEEIRELYSAKLILREDFTQSILILRAERSRIQKDQNKE